MDLECVDGVAQEALSVQRNCRGQALQRGRRAPQIFVSSDAGSSTSPYVCCVALVARVALASDVVLCLRDCEGMWMRPHDVC